MIDLNDLRLGVEVFGPSNNQVINPDGELKNAGWTPTNSRLDSNSIADERSRLGPFYGNSGYRLYLTVKTDQPYLIWYGPGGSNGLYDSNSVRSNFGRVKPGQWVKASFLAHGYLNNADYPAFTPTYGAPSIGVEFYNLAGNKIGEGFSANQQLYATDTRITSPSFQAPANTYYARIVMRNPYHLGAVGFREAQMAVGDTQAAVDSMSYVPTKSYKEVLTATSSMKIKKGDLEVGILQAHIRDANYDPNVDPDISYGRGVRLDALVNGKWERVYTGTIASVTTTYKKGGKPDIALTCVDTINYLATTPWADMNGHIMDARYMLEEVGVPFLVNDSASWTATNGVRQAPPSVTYTKEDASVLDQIVMIRNSAQAHAWVDRHGIVNLYDRAPAGLNLWFDDRPKPVGLFTTQPDGSPIINWCSNPNGEPEGGYITEASFGFTNMWGNYPTDNRVIHTGQGVIIRNPAGGSAVTSLQVKMPNAIQGEFIFDYTVAMRVQNLSNVDLIINTTQGGTPATIPAGATQIYRTMKAGDDGADDIKGIYYGDVIITRPGGATLAAGQDYVRLTDVTFVGGDRYDLPGPGGYVYMPFYEGPLFNGDSPYSRWEGARGLSTSVQDVDAYAPMVDVNVGYDSRAVVNEVKVTRIATRYYPEQVSITRDDGTVDTFTANMPKQEEEVHIYENPVSVEKYGRSAIAFTIPDDTSNDPTIWAAEVMAANQDPVIQAKGIAWAAVDQDTFNKAATIDVLDLVGVIYEDKLNKSYRITSLEHEIRPGKWTVKCEFNKRVDTTLW